MGDKNKTQPEQHATYAGTRLNVQLVLPVDESQ